MRCSVDVHAKLPAEDVIIDVAGAVGDTSRSILDVFKDAPENLVLLVAWLWSWVVTVAIFALPIAFQGIKLLLAKVARVGALIANWCSS